MRRYYFVCDGCQREYKYETVHWSDRMPQPLRVIGKEEFCYSCTKRAEVLLTPTESQGS